MKKNETTFSVRFKELRVEAKLDQDDLAKFFHVDRSTVTGWETKGTEPSYAVLVKIARYFNVTTDYLLGAEDWIESDSKKIN